MVVLFAVLLHTVRCTEVDLLDDESCLNECSCKATDVNTLNKGLHSALEDILAYKFFRIVQINLAADCQFWTINSQCRNEGCQVCECDSNDVPLPWEEERKERLTETIHHVDRRIESNFRAWELTENVKDNSWTVQDDAHVSYIDMAMNPLGYTGYSGEDSWRIWAAAYSQNCFSDGLEAECVDKRVFYRLISGLHSVVSTLICNNFPLNPDHGPLEELIIGPSLPFYLAKVGNFPDRVENMYFGLVFLLRALNKASPLLKEFDYNTGNPAEDNVLQEQIALLLNSEMVQGCSAERTFDEATLFNSPDSAQLRRELHESFRKISMIMDCVGCEQCKLHAKLKVSGLGAALKVLLYEGEDLSGLQLNRNEISSLFHAIGYFSDAISVVEKMKYLQTMQDLTEETSGFAPLKEEL
jgi:ERO1-like protein alpha